MPPDDRVPAAPWLLVSFHVEGRTLPCDRGSFEGNSYRRVVSSVMAPETPQRDAADLIVDALEALGVEFVFGVPGGAIEPLYNALARSGRRGGPQAVVARNEQVPPTADGYARETGRLGVCIATSGPRATNDHRRGLLV